MPILEKIYPEIDSPQSFNKYSREMIRDAELLIQNTQTYLMITNHESKRDIYFIRKKFKEINIHLSILTMLLDIFRDSDILDDNLIFNLYVDKNKLQDLKSKIKPIIENLSYFESIKYKIEDILDSLKRSYK